MKKNSDNLDLFGNPANPFVGASAPTKKFTKGEKGKQCRDCKHCFRHQFRESWVYCGIRLDPRTSHGMMKTKKTATCRLFEKEE